MHGYSLHQLVLRPATSVEMYRTLAFYAKHGILVTRLSLPFEFNEPLLDEHGKSILPSSLIALALGPVREEKYPPLDEMSVFERGIEMSMFEGIDHIERTGWMRTRPIDWLSTDYWLENCLTRNYSSDSVIA